METSMPTLTGQFQIKDWQETTQSEHKGLKRNLANVELEYTGDIVGTSELQYLLSYQVDGAQSLLALNRYKQVSKEILVL
jgi:hypothetical protein